MSGAVSIGMEMLEKVDSWTGSVGVICMDRVVALAGCLLQSLAICTWWSGGRAAPSEMRWWEWAGHGVRKRWGRAGCNCVCVLYAERMWCLL